MFQLSVILEYSKCPNSSKQKAHSLKKQLSRNKHQHRGQAPSIINTTSQYQQLYSYCYYSHESSYLSRAKHQDQERSVQMDISRDQNNWVKKFSTYEYILQCKLFIIVLHAVFLPTALLIGTFRQVDGILKFSPLVFFSKK